MQISTPPAIGTLPIAPPSPALDLVGRFGDQLAALGAKVKIVDADTVKLVYTNNFAGVQAAGALKDSVDGVRLLVDNRSLTADYWEATGANVARWLGQSSIVERVAQRETLPLQLAVFGTGARNEAALGALLRTQLDDGTTIDVQRRMWIM